MATAIIIYTFESLFQSAFNLKYSFLTIYRKLTDRQLGLIQAFAELDNTTTGTVNNTTTTKSGMFFFLFSCISLCIFTSSWHNIFNDFFRR
jgi:hypothetical protein